MAYSKKTKDALEAGNSELIEAIPDEELSNILITLDGLGMEVKKKALEVLLDRAYNNGRFYSVDGMREEGVLENTP